MSVPIGNKLQKVSYHTVPHIYLGNICYFEECRLYIFFPALYDQETNRTFLTNHEYERFMTIFIEVIHEVYTSDITQHLPSSWKDAAMEATAKAKEHGIRKTHLQRRSQMLHEVIPATELLDI